MMQLTAVVKKQRCRVISRPFVKPESCLNLTSSSTELQVSFYIVVRGSLRTGYIGRLRLVVPQDRAAAFETPGAHASSFLDSSTFSRGAACIRLSLVLASTSRGRPSSRTFHDEENPSRRMRRSFLSTIFLGIFSEFPPPFSSVRDRKCTRFEHTSRSSCRRIVSVKPRSSPRHSEMTSRDIEIFENLPLLTEIYLSRIPFSSLL